MDFVIKMIKWKSFIQDIIFLTEYANSLNGKGLQKKLQHMFLKLTCVKKVKLGSMFTSACNVV